MGLLLALKVITMRDLAVVMWTAAGANPPLSVGFQALSAVSDFFLAPHFGPLSLSYRLLITDQ